MNKNKLLLDLFNYGAITHQLMLNHYEDYTEIIEDAIKENYLIEETHKNKKYYYLNEKGVLHVQKNLLNSDKKHLKFFPFNINRYFILAEYYLSLSNEEQESWINQEEIRNKVKNNVIFNGGFKNEDNEWIYIRTMKKNDTFNLKELNSCLENIKGDNMIFLNYK